MANNCITDVIVHGDLGSLHVLKTIMDKCSEHGAVENDWGNNWLGNLVTLFGEDWQKIYCRGYFYDAGEIDEQNSTLRFFTDTAWAPMTEVFQMIERHLPGLKVYYSAEEPGMEIFVTNDSKGRFYPRFIIEWYKPDGDDEPRCCDTLQEALGYISEAAGRKISSEQEVEQLEEEWQQINEDCYVALRIFDIEE